MSSEETLSVGGSEEVRALEYGDGGMESGLSRSDRTKDEVGVREMVEGEGEEIPSNILEIEGGGDRCYDVEANIVSEVKGKGLAQHPETIGCLLRVIIGFVVSYRARGVRVPTMNMFNHFFVLKKAKKANQNKYSLNSDEEEKMEKLVREGGEILNIMYFTSSDVIEAAELYGPSSLSEVEMDKFLSSTKRIAVPKKLRKKSKTSETTANGKGDGNKEKEQISITSVQAVDVDEPRLGPQQKRSEEVDPA
ncbi:hypothetical protein SLEP1_g46993 [Rubroshorea leprosula]|uniref:Uncharacterized protein n=1 Tax=Rubroshorea leprosula TaxID=152421 RepID=A0AAV5LP10_9ROSI|nr:hypothetical protein SLEP1_g46993 [Rubroshorea leprosula]